MGKNKEDRHSWGEVPYLSIQCYSDHPEVYRMAKLVADGLSAGKKRSHRDKYLRPARKFIASLWMHEGDVFRWSTKTSHYGKKRKQVWLTSNTLSIFRKMLEMGYCRPEAKAIPPLHARDGVGRAAIYRRSSSFLNAMATLTFSDIVLDPDLDRITYRTLEGTALAVPDSVKKMPQFQFADTVLRLHSEFLCSAGITHGDGSPMRPIDWHYFRRFKGGFDITGRLYASFTNYPKTKRLGIRFNGVPAISVDFSSLHPYLILRLMHKQDVYHPGLFAQITDPYEMPDFLDLPREVHKTLINALFNSPTLESGIGALNSAFFRQDANGDITVEIYSGRKKRIGEKIFPGGKQAIEKYIDAYKTHHPKLKDAIGLGLGNTLQFIDSNIMLFLMQSCLKNRIPILPVHDEVVFPINQLDAILNLLPVAYREAVGSAGSYGEVPISVEYLAEGVRTKKRYSMSVKVNETTAT